MNTPQIQSAFVTGATGLLGNNLVRLLVSRGVRVDQPRDRPTDDSRAKLHGLQSQQERTGAWSSFSSC